MFYEVVMNEEKSTNVKLTRKQNILQFLKFTGLSISAGAIQILSFTLLNELVDWTAVLPGMASWPQIFRVDYGPNYLIALILSVLYNYTLNRRFTFKSATNLPKAMLKAAGYYAVFTPLSAWWGVALVGIGWNEYVVLIGTMLINFVTEFTFARFVVFRDSINTNELGQKENENRQRQEALTAQETE